MKTLLPLLVALLSVPSVASANDFSFGGVGTNFVPRQETRIRMVSEDIVAEYRGDRWYLEANYVFENPTEESVRLNMGFPESRCTDDSDCHVEVPFRNMLTWVGDEPVHLVRGKQWLRPRFPMLGNVWMYDAAFPPHGHVAIRHTYEVLGTEVIDGTCELMYVTETGALWSGPIEHARFRFRMPPNVRTIDHSEGAVAGHPRLVVVDQRVWAQVEFEFRGWTPTSNLSVAFNTETSLAAGVEVDSEKLLPCALEDLKSEALDSLEVGTDAVDRLVRKWSKFGMPTLRACRHRLTATYGSRFRSKRLNELFYGPSGFVPGEPPYLVNEPNPDFTPGLMSPEDRALYDALLRTETRILEEPKPMHGNTRAAPN